MENRKLTTYQLAATALMTAVMCILGPVSVPIGPVPVSLTNLVIYFAVYLLGAKLGALSVLVYLALGAVGLPVFSGWQGGFAKLAGPTGGYLVGFLLMALLAGLVIERCEDKPVLCALGMAAGTAATYALGTAWFMLQMQCALGYALSACVLPFVPFDVGKIVLAAVFGALLRRRLIQAKVLKKV